MEEKNLNIKIIPPKEYLPLLGGGVLILLALFLLMLIISTGVGISNKIKEGRYIGQGSQYKNTISVSGQGKVFGTPDVAQIDLSVVSQAKTVADGQAENTKKMNEIINAIKDMRIKGEDLKTVNYRISPRYQYISGHSDIIGYEISQTLKVKIRDLEKIGQVLAQATALGANQIGSLTFIIDDPEKLKQEAREAAIANAKDKADHLSKSLGTSLGKITSFSENAYGGPEPIYFEAQMSKMDIGASPQIQTGQNEIEVRVTLTYEIY